MIGPTTTKIIIKKIKTEIIIKITKKVIITKIKKKEPRIEQKAQYLKIMAFLSQPCPWSGRLPGRDSPASQTFSKLMNNICSGLK
jgi:hypothetical protein